MSKVNKATFVDLIEGDLEWLTRVAGDAQTLERRHIEEILRDAPRTYYDAEEEVERLRAKLARVRAETWREAIEAAAQRVESRDEERQALARVIRSLTPPERGAATAATCETPDIAADLCAACEVLLDTAASLADGGDFDGEEQARRAVAAFREATKLSDGSRRCLNCDNTGERYEPSRGMKVTCGCVGLAVRTFVEPMGDIGAMTEADKALVREAKRIGRGNAGADPSMRIGSPADAKAATCGECGGRGVMRDVGSPETWRARCLACNGAGRAR